MRAMLPLTQLSPVCVLMAVYYFHTKATLVAAATVSPSHFWLGHLLSLSTQRRWHLPLLTWVRDGSGGSGVGVQKPGCSASRPPSWWHLRPRHCVLSCCNTTSSVTVAVWWKTNNMFDMASPCLLPSTPIYPVDSIHAKAKVISVLAICSNKLVPKSRKIINYWN